MKRLLAALFVVAFAFTACAHVAPVVTDVVTCSGRTISRDVATAVYTDVISENWADLAQNVVPILSEGWDDVLCIYNALKGQHPELVPHMNALRTNHVELRGTN